MIKKIISVFMAVILIISVFSGCSANESSESTRFKIGIMTGTVTQGEE